MSGEMRYRWAEMNALHWLDDKDNWRAWERETRGARTRARIAARLSYFWLRLRMAVHP